MKLTKAQLRSAPAQLALLGTTLLGGLVLALAAVALRGVVFERSIREAHPETTQAVRQLAQNLAQGRDVALSDADVAALYGACVDDPSLDSDGVVARRLHSADGAGMLERIRKTLVVGSLPQRVQAVRIVGFAAADDLKPEALRLGRYAEERGRRRGEAAWVEAARQARARLEGGDAPDGGRGP